MINKIGTFTDQTCNMNFKLTTLHLTTNRAKRKNV